MRRMRGLISISAVAATMVLTLSCQKESVKLMYSNQETAIENFVRSQTGADESVYAVSNGGSTRVVVKEGSGEALKADGTISFYYAGYVMGNGSISSRDLFATNKEDIAVATGWNISDPDAFRIVTVNLSETELTDGLRNGLEGIKGGEECYVLFSGKYGFGKESGTIPANSALAYHIWVESISNE